MKIECNIHKLTEMEKEKLMLQKKKGVTERATVEVLYRVVKAGLLKKYNLSTYKDQMPSHFLNLICKLFANYICET